MWKPTSIVPWYIDFVTFLKIFLKLLIIILLFDSPVSVKDQAGIRVIYFVIFFFFLSLFGKKVRMAALRQKKRTVH